MDIYINRGAIGKTGNNIVVIANDIQSEINKIAAIVNDINSAWEGEDATKYVNTMHDTFLPKMKEFKDAITEYGTWLEKVPDAYSALDESFASKKLN